MKYIQYILVFILLFFMIFIYDAYSKINNNIKEDNNLLMINNQELSLKVGDSINLNIYDSYTNKIIINKFYKWTSSNNNITKVNNNGKIDTIKSGNVIISASNNIETIKVYLNVYEIKDIIIIVGDSRFDHFKDDNKFKNTEIYEIKYNDINNSFNPLERMYIVSLSGMRYNWLSGEDQYKNNNAINYVSKIIKEYENKTSKTTKYNIKIMTNLGVNDLNHKYLLNDTPSNVALKYLNKYDELMNNEWSSNIINKISLNMITLFPTNDIMTECYFPERYNNDVIEFNNTIISNSKFRVCDAYNDLNFNESYFRDRTNKSCATKDGLHFTPEFNKNILYPYLIECYKK